MIDPAAAATDEPLGPGQYRYIATRAWWMASAFDAVFGAASRTAEVKWKEVRALGVDDIETWLEKGPVTHAWISQLLGRNPYSVRPVDLWWDSWATVLSNSLPSGSAIATA